MVFSLSFRAKLALRGFLYLFRRRLGFRAVLVLLHSFEVSCLLCFWGKPALGLFCILSSDRMRRWASQRSHVALLRLPREISPCGFVCCPEVSPQSKVNFIWRAKLVSLEERSWIWVDFAPCAKLCLCICSFTFCQRLNQVRFSLFCSTLCSWPVQPSFRDCEGDWQEHIFSVRGAGLVI